MLAALILALLAGKSTQVQQNTAIPSNSDIATWRQYPQIQIQSEINQGNKAQDIGNFPVLLVVEGIAHSTVIQCISFSITFSTSSLCVLGDKSENFFKMARSEFPILDTTLNLQEIEF